MAGHAGQRLEATRFNHEPTFEAVGAEDSSVEWYALMSGSGQCAGRSYYTDSSTGNGFALKYYDNV